MNKMARRLVVVFLFTVMLVAPVLLVRVAAAQPTPLPQETGGAVADGKPELTPLTVAEEYVKVVGGAITVVATVLGFPLVFQTFRKTRAEIAKIDLEAAKLRKELGEIGQVKSVAVADKYMINVEGEGNVISVLTDPRWSAPILILIDVFIASFFVALASFAIQILLDGIPLPYLFNLSLNRVLQLVIYFAVFFPVFRAARQVKKNLGGDLKSSQGMQPRRTVDGV